jgi:RimJ/RimL family protein N-acetyltransferase
MSVPVEIRTARLLLRPWRSEDAAALHPILQENWAHLGPWIPARIATPAPIPVLAERLSGFAADFAADREWRYAMIKSDDDAVLGEVGLFPRSATGRVHYAQADRVELGYWLRADATGRGFVTEGAHAMLAAAAALPHVSCVEVRCDARNAPSAAIPRRLGFDLTTTIAERGSSTEPRGELQVWTRAVPGR